MSESINRRSVVEFNRDWDSIFLYRFCQKLLNNRSQPLIVYKCTLFWQCYAVLVNDNLFISYIIIYMITYYYIFQKFLLHSIQIKK